MGCIRCPQHGEVVIAFVSRKAVCPYCFQLSRLLDIAGTTEFKQVFPNAMVLVSAEGIQPARESELPKDYLPFMLERQPNHIDYYAFDMNNNMKRIIVFAKDAVVHDWPDFDGFLIWINQQMIGVKQ